MKQLFVILIFLSFFSCIPLKTAPTIKGDTVMIGKKFKKSLPRNHMFIFEDPKDANEFYNFINTKYDQKENNVAFNVPVKIENQNYFLSFHEIERSSKTVNLVPVVIDAKRESNGNDSLLQEAHVSRLGKWYLGLTVTDSAINDCLDPNYKTHGQVLKYLRNLKEEYLNTTNYLEAKLKEQQKKESKQ